MTTTRDTAPPATEDEGFAAYLSDEVAAARPGHDGHHPDRRPLGFGTRAIHAGEGSTEHRRALGTPLYQNATYGFRSAGHVAAWERGEAPHYIYAREGNPTVHCLELKLADLEGAEMATAANNGMAAISATLATLAPAGSHVVASDALYSITRQHLQEDLPRRGTTVDLVAMGDPAAVERAIRVETTVVYAEAFSNPALAVADIPALAGICRDRGVTLVVDNTFLSPALFRPVEAGADVVVHSATKYLCGHGNALGGVVAGRAAVIAPIAEALTRTGGAMPAFSAWMLLAGVKTLPLRVARHGENAARLAALFAGHPAVAEVRYPGLPGHPGHAVARALVGAIGPCDADPRYGGMIALRLAGGAGASARFLDALRIPTIAVSLGECETLIWPVMGTDLIRLSVGLEDADDLIADFGQALDGTGA